MIVFWRGLGRVLGGAVVALMLATGCAELSIPEAGGRVTVSRVGVDGVAVDVAVSPARSAAVWPCLRQVRLVEGDGDGDADELSAPLVEGRYVVTVGAGVVVGLDAGGGGEMERAGGEEGTQAVFWLESAEDVRAEDGRLFRSRCLYDLVRDRSVGLGSGRW